LESSRFWKHESKNLLQQCCHAPHVATHQTAGTKVSIISFIICCLAET
jgi:hypothetical protein